MIVLVMSVLLMLRNVFVVMIFMISMGWCLVNIVIIVRLVVKFSRVVEMIGRVLNWCCSVGVMKIDVIVR